MQSPEPSAHDPNLPPPGDRLRRAVVVLGMHRSGTSAVAGCLQRLGVDFGPRLMPPTPDNAKGFYEHIDIVNLHDRLLLAAGSSWHDTDPRPPGWLDDPALLRFRGDQRELLRRDFGSARLWGIKDPRLCRLLPWWQPVWAEIHTRPLFVIVLRDPREVAASIARRDGFSSGKAHFLWLLHILEAERATRGQERVFVDFAGFVKDWRREISAVEALLAEPWPIPAEAAKAAAESFVDGSLPGTANLAGDAKLPPAVEEADTALRIERKTGRDLFAILDRVAVQPEATQPLYGSADERANDLARGLAILQRQARWYEEEWQKARRRWEASREESQRRHLEVQKLDSRIRELESVVADVRMVNVAYVRKRQGLFARLLAPFRAR